MARLHLVHWDPAAARLRRQDLLAQGMGAFDAQDEDQDQRDEETEPAGDEE